ncbi:MAG: response regulator [bacterium]
MTDAPEVALVVDDDEAQRELLTYALGKLGISAHAVEGPAAARKWLRHHHPFLILLDIMMPDINGLVFCRWMRAQPSLRDVPVIVQSALRDEETAADVLEAGATDFIRKPVRFEELKAKIERIRTRRG